MPPRDIIDFVISTPFFVFYKINIDTEQRIWQLHCFDNLTVDAPNRL